MHDFANVVASEDLLNEDGLLGEVAQMLSVGMRLSSFLENLASVIGAEVSLYFDGSCLFAQELLAFDVHFEFRLDFEGSSIVPGPLLLALICTQVIDLLQVR